MQSPILLEELIKQHHRDLTAAANAHARARRLRVPAPASFRFRAWLGGNMVALGERVVPQPVYFGRKDPC